MRKTTLILTAAICLAVFAGGALAQSNQEQTKDYSNSPLVTKMMAFDKKKDGKLTRDEITDSRLLRLFDRADANKDGVVTKEELMALAAKMDAEVPPGRGGPGGFDGPPGGFGDGGFGPGPGAPPGGGPGGPPGGPRGPRGFGGPPQPGQVLSPMFQQMLNLTDEQKKQVANLQKEVDARLAKILTSEQMDQMKQMRERGPRGPGRNGGPPPPPPGEGQ